MVLPLKLGVSSNLCEQGIFMVQKVLDFRTQEETMVLSWALFFCKKIYIFTPLNEKRSRHSKIFGRLGDQVFLSGSIV